jgi:signal transduction histidine kinase
LQKELTETSRSPWRKNMALEGPQLDFELLFQGAPSLFLVLEPAAGYTVLGASDAYLRATRTDRGAIVGRGLFEAFPGPVDEGRTTALRASLQRVLTTRAPELTTIPRYDVLQSDEHGAGAGQRFWRALNSPVLSPDGRLRYIIHRVEDAAPPAGPANVEPQAFDVHPRRNKLELQLLRSARDRDEAIRKLRSAHEELEAFDYALANDLRAPLKSIEGFSMLLMERHSDGLDNKARRILGGIEADVQRMSATVDGLMFLSQVSRSKVVKQRTDLTSVARRVVEDLKRHDPRRGVSVEIAEGLEAYVDERLVQVAFANLIGNAWKFTSRSGDARIEIGQHVFAGEKVFYVMDNGVGFDMAHAGRLFAPFVRLHAASDFEGFGIGLATVKRVVDRHDGRIWADAQRDRGATLSFTFGA